MIAVVMSRVVVVVVADFSFKFMYVVVVAVMSGVVVVLVADFNFELMCVLLLLLLFIYIKFAQEITSFCRF